MRGNDFVVNNSLMSIDRPKPENNYTRKTVYAKAHLKQQKTLMQRDAGCNSIHKSINNGFNHGFN